MRWRKCFAVAKIVYTPDTVDLYPSYSIFMDKAPSVYQTIVVSLSCGLFNVQF